MSAILKIRRLLEPDVRTSRLLDPELTVIPTSGASSEAIQAVETVLPRPLSTGHRELLLTWNGLNLDVLRVFGVPPTAPGILDLLSFQQLVPPGRGYIAIGNDPSGFLYFEHPSGLVSSFDHDGGTVSAVAVSVHDFIDNFVFGQGADRFLGREWLEELRALRLTDRPGA
jgi:hypothetical protein